MKKEISFTARLGRIIIGLFFVTAGLFNIIQWQSNLQILQSQGFSAGNIFLIIGIAVQVIFGALLIFGVLQRTSAFLQIILIIITIPLFFNFWSTTGQIEVTMFSQFVYNIGLIGGLLLTIATAQE